MKPSYQKARATRIWQDNIGNEFESATRFLWEDVTRLEGPEGLKNDDGQRISWQNRAPKTVVFFADGSCCCLLGKLQSWDEKWDIYLLQQRKEALLTHLN